MDVAGVARRPHQVGEPSSHDRLITLLSVLVPAAVAAALTGFDLSARSLWLDESATVAISSQHGAALWAAMKHDGGNMMAFYALVHVLFSIFGDSTVVLRLPSVVATAITAGTVSLIGLRLFDRRVGAAAGLLTAFSLPLIYWGQDGRAYALMYVLGAISFLAFIALVDGESSRRPGKPPAWAWPAYTVALVLAMYMSFVAVLVVPAQLVSLIWYRRRFRPIISALVVAGLCSAPLVLVAHGRGAGQLFWIPRPSLRYAADLGQSLLASAAPPLFQLTASSRPLLGLTAIVVVAAGVAALRGARTHTLTSGVSRERWAGTLLASWLVVPVALDTFESVVGQSLFETRYLLLSAPAVSLALAWGLLATRVPRRAGWAALGVLLVLRAVQILPSYGMSPENWHAASTYVLAHSQRGDCIAFYPSDGRMPFDYYFKTTDRAPSSLPRPVLPRTPFTEVRPYVEVYRSLEPSRVRYLAATCPRLWFVYSHVGQPRGTYLSRVHYRRFEALLSLLQGYFPFNTQVGFGYASEVNVRLYTTQAPATPTA